MCIGRYKPLSEALSSQFSLDLIHLVHILCEQLSHFFTFFIFILCALAFCRQICLCEGVRSPGTGLKSVVSCHVGSGN